VRNAFIKAILPGFDREVQTASVQGERTMARPNRDTRMRFGLAFPRSVNTGFGQSADLAREGMKGGMEWLLCAGSNLGHYTKVRFMDDRWS